MALKTTPNDQDVDAYLAQIEEEQKQQDCKNLLEMMKGITGEPPKMWGKSIIGFGSYHYVYDSGREGDWMLTGFAPRKNNLSLYIMSGFDRYPELLNKLGKFKTGKSCLYVKKLADVNREVLEELITASVAYMKKKYS